MLWLWMGILGTTWAAERPPCQDGPPAGWVRLTEASHGVRVDARYASAENFTAAPLPGYHRPEAWLRAEAASALSRAAGHARKAGFLLVVYDAYRPVRATEAMVDWTERTDQPHLISNGYIAARSGHNHGHTVDLSLMTLAGEAVDMGADFDHFGKESHHGAAVSATARHHRSVLKAAMEAAGFRAYSKEWWHYRLPLSGTRPMDVPIGCPPVSAPVHEP